MKKIIFSLALLVSSITLFAQSEEENIAKWINTYHELNSAKNWSEMIGNFDACIKEVPSWYFAYYYKGMAEYNQQNYEGAVADLKNFVSKSDSIPAAYMFLAQSYNALNKPQEALEVLNTYISKVSDDKNAYVEKSNAHMLLQDYNAYIEDLKQVTVLDPKNDAAYKNIASVYGMQKNWQGVIDNLTKAIEISPDNADYYFDRASAEYSIKTSESVKVALEDFNKAEQLGMKDAKLYNYRYACHSMLKDYKGAIEDCNKLLEINPEDMMVTYYRGDANYKLQQYKEAIVDLDKVIASDTVKNTVKINALNRRGACKQQLKDLKGAQADAEMIKKLQGK